jgi:hypothetical protein
MAVSVETLWKMPDIELLAAYYDARRQFVEKKFARELLKADIDVVAMIVRLRGASAPAESESEGRADGREEEGGRNAYAALTPG